MLSQSPRFPRNSPLRPLWLSTLPLSDRENGPPTPNPCPLTTRLSAFPVHALWTFLPVPPSDFPRATPRAQKPRHPVLPRLESHSSPHSCRAAKIRSTFFLNCTKNTELTRVRFARTVTLAHKTVESVSRRFPGLESDSVITCNRHAAHTLSGRAP